MKVEVEKEAAEIKEPVFVQTPIKQVLVLINFSSDFF